MPYPEERFRRQPKQGRSEQRVEQLLESAAELMASHGVTETTMAMIAERAGTSVATLYQYFPNKPAVVRALRSRFGNTMEARLVELQTRAGQLAIEEIALYLVQIACDFTEAHPAYFHVFESTEEGERDPVAKDRLRSQLGEVLRAKQPMLSKRRAQGVAEIATEVLKSMPRLYVSASLKRRKEIASDYRRLLQAHLAVHLTMPGPDEPENR